MKKKFNWAKKARAKGYRVEYDTVIQLRNLGCWAMRLPSRRQVGIMRPIDVIFWNPITKVFGFVQCKFNKKNFHAEEKERFIFVCKKYGATGYLAHRDNGIKMETVYDKF